MSTPRELACIYACLALHDDVIPVTTEKITTLLKVAEAEVESYWPGLFAKLVENRDVDDHITSTGAGGGGGAPVAMACSAAPVPSPVAEEKKKEENVEDSDDYMEAINIFGDD